jgi:hypothetical protein
MITVIDHDHCDHEKEHLIFSAFSCYSCLSLSFPSFPELFNISMSFPTFQCPFPLFNDHYFIVLSWLFYCSLYFTVLPWIPPLPHPMCSAVQRPFLYAITRSANLSLSFNILPVLSFLSFLSLHCLACLPVSLYVKNENEIIYLLKDSAPCSHRTMT